MLKGSYKKKKLLPFFMSRFLGFRALKKQGHALARTTMVGNKDRNLIVSTRVKHLHNEIVAGNILVSVYLNSFLALWLSHS